MSLPPYIPGLMQKQPEATEPPPGTIPSKFQEEWTCSSSCQARCRDQAWRFKRLGSDTEKVEKSLDDLGQWEVFKGKLLTALEEDPAFEKKYENLLFWPHERMQFLKQPTE